MQLLLGSEHELSHHGLIGGVKNLRLCPTGNRVLTQESDRARSEFGSVTSVNMWGVHVRQTIWNQSS